MHETVVKENYKEKIVGYSSTDSTAINRREKSCRKNTPKKKQKKKKQKKKKRGRKSKAELAAMKEQELAKVKTRRLKLQPERSLEENLAHGVNSIKLFFLIQLLTFSVLSCILKTCSIGVLQNL